jgi:hypothetical protein
MTQINYRNKKEGKKEGKKGWREGDRGRKG